MKKVDILDFLLPYNSLATDLEAGQALTEAVRTAIYGLALFDIAYRKDNIKGG